MAGRSGSTRVGPDEVISLYDTKEQLALLRPDIDRAIETVVDSGQFILSTQVEQFEREFASFLGVGEAIGVANGTDALQIALLALGIGPGDDVVVPSFTFFATAEAVVHVGARPVFCDIDVETFCVTAETVERAITPATRAVIPVDLFGTPAPMDELRALAAERGLRVLEDAAQAAGATLGGRRAGSLGDAAAFSFFPTKNLFCLGDGGAITTDDEEVANRARLLRARGSPDGKKSFVEVGFNSRLDELQASVLRVVLARLDELNASRRAVAREYERAGLGDLVELSHPPEGAEPVHHLYVVRSERREVLTGALAGAGFQARPAYARAVHQQEAMAPYAQGVGLPATEEAVRTNLALPMGPTRDADTARPVIEALRQALNSA
jgi:dTDP-4-amino-4,6-dideoxygalactose transaminase